MGSRSPLLLAAPQGLASNGDSVLDLCAAWRLPQERLSPGPALGFSDLPIHPPQDRMPRGGTGGATRKASRVRQGGPRVAPPLGDRRIPPVATEHRTTGQGEDGPERVALTWGTPKIRDLGQDLDQRTCLCSHRCSSIAAFGLV